VAKQICTSSLSINTLKPFPRFEITLDWLYRSFDSAPRQLQLTVSAIIDKLLFVLLIKLDRLATLVYLFVVLLVGLRHLATLDWLVVLGHLATPSSVTVLTWLCH